MKRRPLKHLVRCYTLGGVIAECGIYSGSYLAAAMEVAFTYPVTNQARAVTCRRCKGTAAFAKAAAAAKVRKRKRSRATPATSRRAA